MNIEAYDADSLRKMVRLLEYENKILKDKLKKAGISYEEVNPFEEKIESAEEYDLDQGNRIVNPPYITEKMAIRFFSMFWGREDVYARRGKNLGLSKASKSSAAVWTLLLSASARAARNLADRKSTRLNSSHRSQSRMPSSA